MKNSVFKRTLLCGVGASIALIATPAFAQTKPADEAKDADTIVVTGSIIRRTDANSPSPITVLSADALDKRGVNTVQEAIQRIAAHGAGALPNNFTAGAFAAGASAASLRGLTTSSTLVLFDGLRASYYPLADDGTRNFVDLNTIPGSIVERVEVLKDGASSTYGADAVAGVINVITKKQVVGLHARAEAGITQRGDGAENRLSATYGFGDLDEKGFNFYINGEYNRNALIRSSDRGYPYNTADFSQLCGPANGNNPAFPAGTNVCRTNGIQNGIQFNGVYAGLGTTNVAVVRPYNATNTTPVAGGRFQLLNPAAGCGSLTPITLTGAQLTNTGGNTGAVAAINNCQQDLRKEYNLIAPQSERFGTSARLTLKVGDNSEAYVMANFYQNRTFTSGLTQALRNVTTPAATGVTVSTATLALPVYICPRGTTVPCTVANGTLNPNNPFAALGQAARIQGRLQDPVSNEYLNRSYRGAAGISGTFGGDWKYSFDAVAMRTDLAVTYKNYIFVQHLLDVVADGSYNFGTPSLNSQAVKDYVTPTLVNKSKSEMYQAQASLSKSLFALPGGPLQVAVGAAIRRESVDAPSANSDANGASNRYFTINPFGSTGKRTVKSVSFEIDAPIIDQLDVNVSGRYDDYSSGQSNFSPKIGARFEPIKEIAFRGTFSKGFRIPSFAEANASPTTGFITVNPGGTDATVRNAFIAAHGGGAYATAGYGLGLTTVGTAGLKPEKSESLNLGVVLKPTSWINFTVDYFRIKKKDLITGANYQPAINAYYAGQPIPAGLTVTPGAADPAFPNALPVIGFIGYGFTNADSQDVSGLDFSSEAKFDITDDVSLTSSVEASYVIKYTQTFDDGTPTQRYDGTLGNYQITSASGTPKWRGSWQNTLRVKNATLSATAYYSGGYSQEAEDASGGGTRSTNGDCTANLGSPVASYRDNATPVLCRVKAFINVDMTASLKVNDQFTIYGNVLNVFGAKAPYDPTTYGGSNYNPAWASAGVVGRSFRAGVKVDF
jgi:iron complex outermembrane recepter protein